jgi:hypothetical protein
MGGQPLGVHPVEDRDPIIDVVVELDVVLAFVGSQEPPDVSNKAAVEREWEGEARFDTSRRAASMPKRPGF